MSVFPKVEFWGERRIVSKKVGITEQETDEGYGIVECPCGLKLHIHPGNGAHCPKCKCGFSLTDTTLTIFSAW